MTRPLISTSRGIFQAIDYLPDVVLLEIFDFYRRDIDPYDQWREKYVWFNLTHVCSNWRAVMLASSSRLDLGIIVGPEKPDDISMILSGPLPIILDYKCRYKEITASPFVACVRKITFEGTRGNFEDFFKVTDCAFPVLESLSLRSKYGDGLKFPDTFLGGPDPSNLHLRSLELTDVSFVSIPGFLLSITALADLSLAIDTASHPSSETSLLECLQGMRCMRSLKLSILSSSSSSQPSVPKDIVPLPKLTQFRYDGESVFLDALMAGLSAPFLLEADIDLLGGIQPRIVHLPRFINEIEECYPTAHVTFLRGVRLSLLAPSEYISHCKPHFAIMIHSPDSTIRMSEVLSMRLAIVEELRFTFKWTRMGYGWETWRRFLQQFPSVKALRIEGATGSCIARIFRQDHEEPDDDLTFLPALEEIEVGKTPSSTCKRQTRSWMAPLRPFISARQQAGRPVKVFFNS
jgi:hypothetical protein